jgi:AraC-like DNA-binding protein
MIPRSAESLPMPIAYFHLVLREFGEEPGVRAALLAGTDVSSRQLAEPGAEITVGQQFRQFQNLERLLPAGWGLRAGSGFHASTHGPVGFAAVSAPTLGDSLAVLARFGRVRVPYYLIESQSDERALTIFVKEFLALRPHERIPLLEMLMLSVQALIESVLGSPMDRAHIDFAFPPPTYADRYPEHFHASVRFGCPNTALAIPLEWLSLDCPLADPVMFEASLRELEVLERRLEGGDYIAARVEHLLATSGDAGLSLDQAAARMRLSRRTLVRRLGHVGTSFRALLEAHHRERASALLAEARLDIGEVGYRLGYRDPANFGRACRRWFGMSPTRYRRSLPQRG